MAATVIAFVAAHRFGSPTKKAVMMCLAEHADGDTLSTIVGQARIACETEYTERSVGKAMRALEADGLITRTRRMRGLTRTSDRTTINRAAVKALTQCMAYIPEQEPASPSEVPEQEPDAPRTGTSRPPEQERRSGEPSVTKNRQKNQTLAPDGASNGHDRKDPIFEALVDVCGWDLHDLTKTARGRANAAAKELRDIGASSDGIRARADVYRRRWPDIDLTPNALSANYATLGTKPPDGTPPRSPDCDDCGQPLNDRHTAESCAEIVQAVADYRETADA